MERSLAEKIAKESREGTAFVLEHIYLRSPKYDGLELVKDFHLTGKYGIMTRTMAVYRKANQHFFTSP